MSSSKPRIAINATFLISIFAFIFIWFAEIKPLFLFDADDWTYIASYVREAVPLWGKWNPARVLPEVLMPLCGEIANHAVFPLTGDFMISVSLVCAFTVSLFITAYVASFKAMLRRLYRMNEGPAIAMSVLFLALHFLIFRVNHTNNRYLFHANDLTCYFFYVIPAVLNSALVMHMIGNPRYDRYPNGHSWFSVGIFIAILYFAIFSNMTASGIVAAYAGYRLTTAIIRNVKHVFTKDFFERVWLFALILVAWLVSAIYEANGGRSKQMQGLTDISLGQRLSESFGYLIEVLRTKCSDLFIGLCAVCVVLSIVILVISFLKKTGNKEADSPLGETLIMNALCIPAIIIYTLLLTAMVKSSYIMRPEYIFSIAFFVILLAMLCLGYIVARCPRFMVVLPVLVCVILSCINTNSQTFMPMTSHEFDQYKIGTALLRQFTEAEETGALEEMQLHVPVYDSASNWPLALYLGDRMSGTLYKLGIISSAPHIEVIPDPDFNEKYVDPIFDIPQDRVVQP